MCSPDPVDCREVLKHVDICGNFIQAARKNKVGDFPGTNIDRAHIFKSNFAVVTISMYLKK